MYTHDEEIRMAINIEENSDSNDMNEWHGGIKNHELHTTHTKICNWDEWIKQNRV